MNKSLKMMRKASEQANQQQKQQPIKKIQDNVQEAAHAETSPKPVRRRRAYVFQFGLFLLIVASSILTFLAQRTAFFPIDLQITHTIQNITNPFVSGLMSVVSWAGNSPQAFIIPVIIIGSLYGFGLRWEAIASLATVVLGAVTNLLLKIAIHRPRPASRLIHVNTTFGGYSFPSGHVMYYAGFFGFICFLAFTLFKPSWKRNLLFIIFGGHILLVGASRIYLGAHWASDVLGAYLLGGLVLMVFIQFYRWGKKRYFIHQPVAEGGEQAS
jgi:membrane-associated phospholipid phosphatase